MASVSGYNQQQLIHQGSHTLVYTANRILDGEPVIIKQLRQENTDAEHSAQYRKEHELLQSLNSDNIIKCFDLVHQDGILSLILENFTGQPLSEHLKANRVSLIDAIKVVMKVSGTLDYIHSRKIVHRDINPANILCDPTLDKIKIIDFGLASSTLFSLTTAAQTNNRLEGSIEYISPEQTGRINRSVDYRSDLYSLGATLFQLLTGETPFHGNDYLEIVFQQLAKQPPTPSSIVATIPEALDRIVLKLMQKSPEDRYQSTYAIGQDLQHCLDHLEKVDGKLLDFEIALDDIPEQLNISERMLQRDDQRSILSDIMHQVEKRQYKAISIVGDVGTGKSTLLREIHSLTVRQNGMVATSRPNIVSTDIPYSTLAESLKDFSRQLLTRTDLVEWRSEMTRSIGDSLHLILELAPELKTVLGLPAPQSTKPIISPQETRNRLLSGISGFFTFLATRAAPITLCIDNFQWADEASLDVFEALLTKFRPPGVLFVSASRNDIRASTKQTLLSFVDEEKNNEYLTIINTTNLDVGNVALLISDSLFHSLEEATPLAKVIHSKTNGNPLAIREFINLLYSKNMIFFNRVHREWDWNLEAIKAEPPSENVGIVLSNKIQDLEPNTARVLKIAACIGQEFDLNTIKTISGMSFSESSSRILQSVRDGYLVQIEPTDGTVRYRFSHETIQQAAYSLLEVVERRQIHSHIGEAYLRNSTSNAVDNIFDIVNQLNSGFDSPELAAVSKLKLAELNLDAGRRAKQGAAFQAAFRYFRTAIALQGQQVWQHYELSLCIHLEAAEAAYLCGDRRQLETLIAATLVQAKTPIDKCKAYEIQLRALVAYNELDAAIDIGHKVLLLLGHPIREDIRLVNLLLWQIKLLIQTRNLNSQSLNDPIEMSDPIHLAVMRVLSLLSAAGYLSGRQSTAAYILKMTDLSVKFGIAPETSIGYTMFGALTINSFGTIQSGYKFGTMALASLNDSNLQLHCRTITLVQNFILGWKHHIRDTLEPLAHAYRVGMEIGDVESALVAGITGQVNAFILGSDLNSLETNLSNYNKMAHEYNQTSILSLGSIYQQAVKNLISPTSAPWLLEGEIYHEVELLQYHQTSGDESSMAHLFIVKLFLAVLFGHKEHAIEFAQEARTKFSSAVSSTIEPFFILNESLAYISQIHSGGLKQRLKFAHRIRSNQRSLRKRIQHAPENALHAYHLLEAELARVSKNPGLAISNYELAIYYAREHGYLKHHAMACELAGRFYESTDKHELALFHLRKARSGYVRWGAMTKVHALDKEYIELSEEGYLSHQSRNQPTLTTSSFNEGSTSLRSNFLDLGSVIKASQVLSGEIILSNLLKRLMQVALENAGAHGACLVLSQGDELFLEISSRFNGTTTEHELRSLPVNESMQLPISVIQYVARTQEDLVLNDPENEDIFTQDDYVVQHRPKSILCFPVLSKSHLTGVLYLENLQSNYAFTQDRVAVLKLLASQSAIAIENAKLYKQLNDSRNKYLSLYENAVEGIFEFNINGQVINVNPAALQLMGFVGEEADIPKLVKFDELFVDQSDIDELRERLFSQERVMGFETQLRRLDDRQIWVAMSIKLVNNENGEPVHVEGSLIDITERKLRQQAEQATRLAEAATETKSQFLANMSHEIRTPMNAILGYTELALKTHLTEQQTAYLSTIKNSSGHLLRVVNDILDISKVESGKLELQKVPFKLSDIFRDIENLFRLSAEQKDICLSLPDVHDDTYIGDPIRIGQVLINLVNNALKFTRSGAITVEIEVLPLHDGTHSLNFTVSDTGIGIASSDLEIIFESFIQTSTESNESGTGLGLAICRNLVNMMQGHIHATSKLGEGSQFYFSIIVDGVTDIDISLPQIVAREQFGNNTCVLLVEDNEINQELAKEVLESSGFIVIVANNGLQALDILESTSVDIVLMDLRMPIMDGNEAISIIRQKPDLKSLPVIALSAGVPELPLATGASTTFNHYVSKPVDFEKLLLLIAELCHLSIPKLETLQPITTRCEINGIDFSLALRNHDHDARLLQRLLAEFVKVYHNASDDLSEHIQQGSKDKAIRLVHNIAGVAGSFGATALMKAARKLEHKLDESNQPIELPAREYQKLETELENFTSAINQYLTDIKQTA